jgi:amidophosphoribosyltransferase
MARLEDLIAFRAMLALLEKYNKTEQLKKVYDEAKSTINHNVADIQNHVKPLYDQFTDDEISKQISVMLRTQDIKAEVDVIFQSVANLHEACPENRGDWYFTGNYPTDGGNKVVNQAYINFYEGNKGRAY